MRGAVKQQRVTKAKRMAAKRLRRTMTPAERTLWSFLRRNRLAGFHFRRQQVIRGFIVDFYCHRSSLVVELDGSAHDEAKDYDDARDRVLVGLGLSVQRFPNDMVEKDPYVVLDHILCAARIGDRTTFPLPQRGRGTGG